MEIPSYLSEMVSVQYTVSGSRSEKLREKFTKVKSEILVLSGLLSSDYINNSKNSKQASIPEESIPETTM